MKRKLQLYLSLILFLMAAVVYWAGDFSYHNFLPRTALPERYRAYKTAADGPESRHYRLQLLAEGDIREIYYDSTGRNVIITVGRDIILPDSNNGYRITYYKTDISGNLTDSFVNDHYALYYLNGYLLQQDYYYTWVIDGDTTPHAYLRLDSTDKNSTPKQLLASYYNRAQLLQLFSHYDITSDDSTGRELDRVALFIDGLWYMLRGYELVDYNVYPPKYAAAQQPMHSTTSDHEDLRNDVRNWHNTSQPLYISYFRKTHFRNSRGPAFMSPNGNGTPGHWEGTAFLNLVLQQDTLKIREETLFLVEDDPWYYYYSQNHCNISYYTHPALQYGLYTNNDYQLYITKRK